MLRNHLLIAIRHLLRHKVYSAINIFGLAIGLAASAVIFLWVRYEYSFDRHHEKADRIFRIIREIKAEDGSSRFSSGISGPLAPSIQEKLPGIEESVRMWRKRVWVQSGGKGFDQIVCLADSSLLRVFTIPLVVGDQAAALAEPNAVIISRSMATRFFADEDPIGSILDLQDIRYFTGKYRVSAVMEDIPETSSHPFPFDCVFSTLPEPPIPTWQWQGFSDSIQSYLLLSKATRKNALAQKVANHRSDFLSERAAAARTYHLQPLGEVHLHSTTDFRSLSTDVGQTKTSYGNVRTVYFLSTAACLILFVAAVNFVNLTTARATRRAREVGVRKAVGAPRLQLIRQYLLESVVVAGLSGILAIGLVEIGVRVLTELPPWLAETRDLPFLLLPTCVVVGLIAGTYPAFYLSAFNPVRVLKGSIQTSAGRSKARGGLVLTQFAISILLLVGTLTVGRQMRFILNKNLGFDREHVVATDIFRRDPDRTLLRRYEIVKQELLKHPDIVAATGYQNRVGLGDQGPVGERWNVKKGGSGESLRMGTLVIDEDFLKTMGTRLLTGRNLDRPGDIFETGVAGEGRGVDWEQSISILLNESAVQKLGWENPIGKVLTMGRGMPATVVGVVEDFHMGSLHDDIGPMIVLS